MAEERHWKNPSQALTDVELNKIFENNEHVIHEISVELRGLLKIMRKVNVIGLEFIKPSDPKCGTSASLYVKKGGLEFHWHVYSSDWSGLDNHTEVTELNYIEVSKHASENGFLPEDIKEMRVRLEQSLTLDSLTSGR